MNNNTLKNIFYVLFTAIIFIAYNINFSDIVMQTGLGWGVAGMFILLIPVCLTIHKLINELPSKN